MRVHIRTNISIQTQICLYVNTQSMVKILKGCQNQIKDKFVFRKYSFAIDLLIENYFTLFVLPPKKSNNAFAYKYQ